MEVTCVSCGGTYKLSYTRQTDGGYICRDCVDYEMEYASTLVNFSTKGERVARITNYFNTQDWADEVVGRRKWVDTGGWRGYFETPLKDGYTRLSVGWGTGMPDHTVQRKNILFALEDLLRAEGRTLPGEGVYVLAEPTSNVFSTAIEFFCKAEDEEAIREWLARHEFAVERIEHALS